MVLHRIAAVVLSPVAVSKPVMAVKVAKAKAAEATRVL